MGTVKAFRFPVSVAWRGGRLTHASAPGKPGLDVATPPEFKGGLAGVWSPEDLLVAATASCYAVTLVAVAERRQVPLHRLEVHGTGHVGRRDDGRLGFLAIELSAAIATDEPSVAGAREAARLAKDLCVISIALDAPVHLELTVEAVPASAERGAAA